MSSLIPSASASGSGSMTLLAPVTASAQTITLPDATGTALLGSSSQLAKAWVSFNGTSGAIYGTSFNVSSVTRTTTGQYVVNMTTAMPNANYAVVASISVTGTAPEGISINSGTTWNTVTPTTTAFSLATYRYNGVAQDDSTYISAVVFSS